MTAFITCYSNLVPLLEGLCSSNLCRFEFSIFGVFAGIEPTTSGLTVPRSDQLSWFYIVPDTCDILWNLFVCLFNDHFKKRFAMHDLLTNFGVIRKCAT